MQMATAIEADNGEMIVKRVSVPIGLEELMEGLTKEVIAKKPRDICVFASEYFAKLLNLREKGSLKASSGKRLRSITKQISSEDVLKQLQLTSTTKALKTVGTSVTRRSSSNEKNNDKAKSFLEKRRARKDSKEESNKKTQKVEENAKTPRRSGQTETKQRGSSSKGSNKSSSKKKNDKNAKTNSSDTVSVVGCKMTAEGAKDVVAERQESVDEVDRPKKEEVKNANQPDQNENEEANASGQIQMNKHESPRLKTEFEETSKDIEKTKIDVPEQDLVDNKTENKSEESKNEAEENLTLPEDKMKPDETKDKTEIEHNSTKTDHHEVLVMEETDNHKKNEVKPDLEGANSNNKAQNEDEGKENIDEGEKIIAKTEEAKIDKEPGKDEPVSEDDNENKENIHINNVKMIENLSKTLKSGLASHPLNVEKEATRIKNLTKSLSQDQIKAKVDNTKKLKRVKSVDVAKKTIKKTKSKDKLIEDQEDKKRHKRSTVQQSSFDSSMLRNEIKEAADLSKGTGFKTSYNPYKLRQEIRQASRDDEGSRRSKMSEVVAATRIQALWRRFASRKKLEESRQVANDGRDMENQKEGSQKVDEARQQGSNTSVKTDTDVVAGEEIGQDEAKPEEQLPSNDSLSNQNLSLETQEAPKSIDKQPPGLTSKDHHADGLDTLAAILKIQSLWRGFKVRQQLKNTTFFGATVEKKVQDKEALEVATDKAVCKIQALWRGYKVRKNVKDVNTRLAELQRPSECDELSSQRQLTDEDIFKAATRIQARIRGYMVRKANPKVSKLKSITEETGEDRMSDEQVLKAIGVLEDVPRDTPELPPSGTSQQLTKAQQESSIATAIFNDTESQPVLVSQEECDENLAATTDDKGTSSKDDLGVETEDTSTNDAKYSKDTTEGKLQELEVRASGASVADKELDNKDELSAEMAGSTPKKDSEEPQSMNDKKVSDKDSESGQDISQTDKKDLEQKSHIVEEEDSKKIDMESLQGVLESKSLNEQDGSAIPLSNKELGTEDFEPSPNAAKANGKVEKIDQDSKKLDKKDGLVTHEELDKRVLEERLTKETSKLNLETKPNSDESSLEQGGLLTDAESFTKTGAEVSPKSDTALEQRSMSSDEPSASKNAQEDSQEQTKSVNEIVGTTNESETDKQIGHLSSRDLEKKYSESKDLLTDKKTSVKENLEQESEPHSEDVNKSLDEPKIDSTARSSLIQQLDQTDTKKEISHTVLEQKSMSTDEVSATKIVKDSQEPLKTKIVRSTTLPDKISSKESDKKYSEHRSQKLDEKYSESVDESKTNKEIATRGSNLSQKSGQLDKKDSGTEDLITEKDSSVKSDNGNLEEGSVTADESGPNLEIKSLDESRLASEIQTSGLIQQSDQKEISSKSDTVFEQRNLSTDEVSATKIAKDSEEPLKSKIVRSTTLPDKISSKELDKKDSEHRSQKSADLDEKYSESVDESKTNKEIATQGSNLSQKSGELHKKDSETEDLITDKESSVKSDNGNLKEGSVTADDSESNLESKSLDESKLASEIQTSGLIQQSDQKEISSKSDTVFEQRNLSTDELSAQKDPQDTKIVGSVTPIDKIGSTESDAKDSEPQSHQSANSESVNESRADKEMANLSESSRELDKKDSESKDPIMDKQNSVKSDNANLDLLTDENVGKTSLETKSLDKPKVDTEMAKGSLTGQLSAEQETFKDSETVLQTKSVIESTAERSASLNLGAKQLPAQEDEPKVLVLKPQSIDEQSSKKNLETVDDTKNVEELATPISTSSNETNKEDLKRSTNNMEDGSVHEMQSPITDEHSLNKKNSEQKGFVSGKERSAKTEKENPEERKQDESTLVAESAPTSDSVQQDSDTKEVSSDLKDSALNTSITDEKSSKRITETSSEPVLDQSATSISGTTDPESRSEITHDEDLEKLDKKESGSELTIKSVNESPTGLEGTELISRELGQKDFQLKNSITNKKSGQELGITPVDETEKSKDTLSAELICEELEKADSKQSPNEQSDNKDKGLKSSENVEIKETEIKSEEDKKDSEQESITEEESSKKINKRHSESALEIPSIEPQKGEDKSQISDKQDAQKLDSINTDEKGESIFVETSSENLENTDSATAIIFEGLDEKGSTTTIEGNDQKLDNKYDGGSKEFAKSESELETDQQIDNKDAKQNVVISNEQSLQNLDKKESEIKSRKDENILDKDLLKKEVAGKIANMNDESKTPSIPNDPEQRILTVEERLANKDETISSSLKRLDKQISEEVSTSNPVKDIAKRQSKSLDEPENTFHPVEDIKSILNVEAKKELPKTFSIGQSQSKNNRLQNAFEGSVEDPDDSKTETDSSLSEASNQEEDKYGVYTDRDILRIHIPLRELSEIKEEESEVKSSTESAEELEEDSRASDTFRVADKENLKTDVGRNKSHDEDLEKTSDRCGTDKKEQKQTENNDGLDERQKRDSKSVEEIQKNDVKSSIESADELEEVSRASDTFGVADKENLKTDVGTNKSRSEDLEESKASGRCGTDKKEQKNDGLDERKERYSKSVEEVQKNDVKSSIESTEELEEDSRASDTFGVVGKENLETDVTGNKSNEDLEESTASDRCEADKKEQKNDELHGRKERDFKPVEEVEKTKIRQEKDDVKASIESAEELEEDSRASDTFGVADKENLKTNVTGNKSSEDLEEPCGVDKKDQENDGLDERKKRDLKSVEEVEKTKIKPEKDGVKAKDLEDFKISNGSVATEKVQQDINVKGTKPTEDVITKREESNKNEHIGDTVKDAAIDIQNMNKREKNDSAKTLEEKTILSTAPKDEQNLEVNAEEAKSEMKEVEVTKDEGKKSEEDSRPSDVSEAVEKENVEDTIEEKTVRAKSETAGQEEVHQTGNTKTEEKKPERRHIGLLHSGEFHDTITVPISISPPGTLSITSPPPGLVNTGEITVPISISPPGTAPVTSPPPGLVNTGEFHDNVLPLSVHVNEDSPAGAALMTSLESERVPAGAQASIKDASTRESTTRPDTTTSSTAGMESEKRNNASSLPKKSMEAEAATKIQAGFRGYQVRKQLKNKISASGDITNQRRSSRRKSAGRISESGRLIQNKPKQTSDIEEKSAVKIQAGIRGFLVRRRQKKQKVGKDSA